MKQINAFFNYEYEEKPSEFIQEELKNQQTTIDEKTKKEQIDKLWEQNEKNKFNT